MLLSNEFFKYFRNEYYSLYINFIFNISKTQQHQIHLFQQSIDVAFAHLCTIYRHCFPFVDLHLFIHLLCLYWNSTKKRNKVEITKIINLVIMKFFFFLYKSYFITYVRKYFFFILGFFRFLSVLYRRPIEKKVHNSCKQNILFFCILFLFKSYFA